MIVESVKGGPVPRYYQLKELIRGRIRGGEWAPGMVIPSERELCERHDISRTTARESITELVHEQLLYPEQSTAARATSHHDAPGSADRKRQGRLSRRQLSLEYPLDA